jgi:hypothetical protein
MGWGQSHALAALPPGTRIGILCIGGPGVPQGRSGQVWKISLPAEFDPQTVDPVMSRYTD